MEGAPVLVTAETPGWGRGEPWRRRFAVGLLSVAGAALLSLHLIQPELSLLHTPVSFYVHGAHGWLLPIALGAFGGAAVVMAGRPGESARSWSEWCWLAFGIGMLVTAALPSDPWFPWEQTPTAAGVIHAAAAVVAPVFLVFPLVQAPRLKRSAGKLSGWIALTYVAALLGCATSLGVGFIEDQSPPGIGAAERVLAAAAYAGGWLHAFRPEGRGEGPVSVGGLPPDER